MIRSNPDNCGTCDVVHAMPYNVVHASRLLHMLPMYGMHPIACLPPVTHAPDVLCWLVISELFRSQEATVPSDAPAHITFFPCRVRQVTQAEAPARAEIFFQFTVFKTVILLPVTSWATQSFGPYAMHAVILLPREIVWRHSPLLGCHSCNQGPMHKTEMIEKEMRRKQITEYGNECTRAGGYEGMAGGYEGMSGGYVRRLCGYGRRVWQESIIAL